MEPDDSALRDRVRQVVAETGVTPAQFAADLSLDPDKLSKSLTGVRRFTVYELAVIADRAGKRLTGCSPARSRRGSPSWHAEAIGGPAVASWVSRQARRSNARSPVR